jgi:hypothetical protein
MKVEFGKIKKRNTSREFGLGISYNTHWNYKYQNVASIHLGFWSIHMRWKIHKFFEDKK